MQTRCIPCVFAVLLSTLRRFFLSPLLRAGSRNVTSTGPLSISATVAPLYSCTLYWNVASAVWWYSHSSCFSSNPRSRTNSAALRISLVTKSSSSTYCSSLSMYPRSTLYAGWERKYSSH